MKRTKKGMSTALSYQPYLLELRRRLVVTLSVFAGSFLVGFFLFQPLTAIILRFFNLNQVVMVVSSPFRILNLAATVGLLVGLLATTPVALYHLAHFIVPALSAKERRLLLPLSLIGLVLFVLGFSLGLLIMNWAVLGLARVFLGGQLKNYWDTNIFLSQVLTTAILLGLAFQFPLVLFFLVKSSLVSLASLRQKRWLVFGIVVILAALLPPTDAVSLVAISALIMVVFEASLFWLGKTQRG